MCGKWEEVRKGVWTSRKWPVGYHGAEFPLGFAETGHHEPVTGSGRSTWSCGRRPQGVSCCCVATTALGRQAVGHSLLRHTVFCDLSYKGTFQVYCIFNLLLLQKSYTIPTRIRESPSEHLAQSPAPGGSTGNRFLDMLPHLSGSPPDYFQENLLFPNF